MAHGGSIPMSTRKPTAADDDRAVRCLDRAIPVLAAVELLSVAAFGPLVNQ
jgi:hypothetical protein